MRYRKLDAGGDYSFGHGLRDFYIDQPEAPAQAVVTRLNLWEGEWFLDTREGTPWKTQVLGKYTGNTRDAIMRTRALQTKGVKRIASYSSTVNPNTRKFAADIVLDTDYGAASITEPK